MEPTSSFLIFYSLFLITPGPHFYFIHDVVKMGPKPMPYTVNAFFDGVLMGCFLRIRFHFNLL
jgi:hypothetical protein